MKNDNLDLVCFSYLAPGTIFKIKQYPKINYGTEILETIKTIAADGPMVAVGCARLNLKVGLITNPIGKDQKQIINYLNKQNVISKIKILPKFKTPFIIILSDSKGNREWFPYIPKVNLYLKKVNLGLLRKSSLVYIDYYQVIREASQRAINFASHHKIPIFINLGGSPFTSKVSNSLKEKNIVIIQTNLEENKAKNAPSLAKRIYHGVKPKIAIVTLGSKGALAVTSNKMIKVPTFKVKVNHLHGAGAAFSVDFIFGYLNGWETEKCLLFGCTLGTINCTLERGFETFSQKEVKEFLKKWPE